MITSRGRPVACLIGLQPDDKKTRSRGRLASYAGDQHRQSMFRRLARIWKMKPDKGKQWISQEHHDAALYGEPRPARPGARGDEAARYPESMAFRKASKRRSSRNDSVSHEGIGKLSEQERTRMLQAFDRLVPKIPSRPPDAVERELAELRRSRRQGRPKVRKS
jgi:antitoxin (DNA-binding transcriptional repressor) of toxin-antitoxin stability system